MATQNEIPKDRLATTDERGDRVYIYPADVRGYWRRLRTLSQWILILFFLLLPWIKINGHQAVLLDIVDRRFALFGLTFWAHDGPLIFFILAGATFSLALVTAVWGRVWCGWACPQTVFIDGLYRRVERLIEGNHLQRKKLDQGETPLTTYLFKKSLKWLAFFLLSALIAHSFAAYFVGTDELMNMVRHSPSENWTTFIVVSFITVVLFFDFGWFKEQFCFIMCPYGRFQSVLMDKGSLAVMYDEKRGEPRRTGTKSSTDGDCISCGRCTAVCPTGIDIRRGIQMECINCTACIDACDEVMEKIQKPKGLIRYSSILKMANKKVIRTWRVYAYSFVVLISIVGLSYNIMNRSPLHFNMMRVKGAPYYFLSGEESKKLMNQFKAHVQNQTDEPMEIRFQLPADLENRGFELIEQKKSETLQPGEIITHFLFIKFPQNEVKSNKEKIQIRLIGENPKIQLDKTIELLSP